MPPSVFANKAKNFLSTCLIHLIELDIIVQSSTHRILCPPPNYLGLPEMIGTDGTLSRWLTRDFLTEEGTFPPTRVPKKNGTS